MPGGFLQLAPMLDPDNLLEAYEAEAELRRTAQFFFYRPYPTQAAFMAATKNHVDLGLFAGNRQGKTYAGAFMVTVFTTGIYPSWWEGRRFDRPVKLWVCGESATALRDAAQGKLIGGFGASYGTGMIPQHLLQPNPRMARGQVDLIDTMFIRHVTGGLSTVQFKTYSQEVKDWAGASIDGIWYDEEPPEDHKSEGDARTFENSGLSFMTFTPMKGASVVVKRFLREPIPGKRKAFQSPLSESKHFTQEMIENMKLRWPP